MLVTEMRSHEMEILDSHQYSEDEYITTLRQLATINRYTLAYQPTLLALDRVARETKQRPLRVLDIGFGYGDTLRAIARWSEKKKISVEIEAVDINANACEIAHRATPPAMPIRFRTADALALEDVHADVITNSLFMHHLPNEKIVEFMGWMTANARVAWFINDLHRHWLPYFFIKHVTRLFRFTPMIQNDAPLSVARSFKARELVEYARQAGIPVESLEIRWHWPFRFGVYCDTRRARGEIK